MNLYHDISRCAANLSKHPLMQYFDAKGRGVARPFDFAPKMAFFVLGFKDMLAVTAYPNPKTRLEHDLNTHCKEDAEHWQWFLHDLQTLSTLGLITNTATCSPQAVLADIWSERNFEVRKFTYDLVKRLDDEPSAAKKHMIVECLEAAFGVFVQHLTTMSKHLKVYDKLKYFGQQHHIDEAQHAMGAWVDGHKEGSSHLSAADYAQLQPVVEEIFSGFNAMFDCWLEAVNQAASRPVNQPTPAEAELA
ncbi:MAG TPA: hypothetical protein VIC26_11205 [Marinagarivorans sp.]